MTLPMQCTQLSHGEWDAADAEGGCRTLRLGTWNGRGLCNQLLDTVAIADSLRLDAFCLQETRFRPNSMPSMNKCLRHKGWRIDINDQGQRSVAILSRFGSLNIKCVAYSKSEPFLEGIIFARMQMPNSDPLTLVTLHTPSGPYQHKQRAELFDNVFTKVASMGDRFVIIGDSNEAPTTGNLVPVLARDLATWLDPVEARDIPTHRHMAKRVGKYAKRTGSKLDYALADNSTVMTARRQIVMPQKISDHDVVAYAIQHEPTGDTFSLTKAADLSQVKPVSSDDFACAFQPVREQFFDDISKPNFDAERPWRLISDVAELLLGRSAHSSARPRAKAAQPRRNGAPSASAVAVEPLVLVHLRRLQRIHLALAMDIHVEGQTSNDTKRRWTNFRRILANRFPTILTRLPPPWVPGNAKGTEALDDFIRAVEHEDHQQRIATWHQKMTSVRMAKQWLERNTDADAPLFNVPRDIHPTAHA